MAKPEQDRTERSITLCTFGGICTFEKKRRQESLGQMFISKVDFSMFSQISFVGHMNWKELVEMKLKEALQKVVAYQIDVIYM